MLERNGSKGRERGGISFPPPPLTAAQRGLAKPLHDGVGGESCQCCHHCINWLHIFQVVTMVRGVRVDMQSGGLPTKE